jgi:hypothetical protein
MAFTIDFDFRKSITLTDPQSVAPRPDYAYKLRPTLRIVDTALAGTFSGEVDGTWLESMTGAPVGSDPTGSGALVYTAAYLPAGDYTAALTCDFESDDPTIDQANTTGGTPTPEVIFLDQQNVTVAAGMTTKNVNFPSTP